MASTYGTYTTAALAAAGSVTALGPNDNVGTVQVSGTYTSVAGTIQVTTDPPSVASPAWNNVDLIRVDTLALEQSPTWTDSTTRTWKFDLTGIQQVRVNITGGTLTSGMVIRVSTNYTQVPLAGVSYATSVGGNQAITGQVVITSASANALTAGRLGSTTPAFNVDASTATSTTGVNVKSAANTGGVALAAIGGNGNENMSIDAVGSGIITLAGTSTGGANVRIPVYTAAAAGTTIGNVSGLLKEGFNYITAANNALAVQLPVGAVGMQVTVVNAVYTAGLIIFPQVNSAINNLTANASYNLGNGGKRIMTYAATNQWYTDLVAID